MTQPFSSGALVHVPRLSRRQFLRLGGLAVATWLVPGRALAHRSGTVSEKALALYNLHTGERLRTVYWFKGNYLPEALQEISYLLRDYRAEAVRPIDPELIDLLHALSVKLEARQPFHVISGYRTPATNAMLRRYHGGVAKRSFHMYGKAVDFRLPGRSLAALRRAAISLHRGGVGYYPRSGFIHVDTGPVRYW
ncbi:MAG: twin-arginine translocation pathway signal protein [Candidatus Tectimicrobiota bacterium]|nr:MAG: twin-arginine translocation pathway signal protein [Candidatus Tectomicrobia bacterium]